jgi:hypothetical protein
MRLPRSHSRGYSTGLARLFVKRRGVCRRYGTYTKHIEIWIAAILLPRAPKLEHFRALLNSFLCSLAAFLFYCHLHLPPSPADVGTLLLLGETPFFAA